MRDAKARASSVDRSRTARDGRNVLKSNPALLMGAIAGACQNTAPLRAAPEESQSAVPGIGYPVPLAITIVSLSVVAYFFALFV